MKHEQERLELVTDFSRLKVGDLVVVKPCGYCGSSHRAMLIRMRGVVGEMGSPGGISHGLNSIDAHPLPSCRSSGQWVVTEDCVRQKKVYIVETGLTQEQETTEAAPARRPVGVRL